MSITTDQNGLGRGFDDSVMFKENPLDKTYGDVNSSLEGELILLIIKNLEVRSTEVFLEKAKEAKID